MKKINSTNRRDFLKKVGITTVPLILPFNQIGAVNEKTLAFANHEGSMVNMVHDGLLLSPKEYIKKLSEIEAENHFIPDNYGEGGITKKLEEKFAKLTGKEKAIYLPSGTMANELAIKLLNGDNTKVIVPENSHIHRDEADAAQSVHGLRLVPVGQNKNYFDLNDLKNAISYIDNNEVFKSGLGTVAIENPVRRANGAAVPIEVIEEISNYCRSNGLKMHLDGARLHIASAYTDVPISRYASYFDTVYISLYKYLNTAGGAILCGPADIIDRIQHERKILGGEVYQTWANTAVADYYLENFIERFKPAIVKAENLFTELNTIEEINIQPFDEGTNVYSFQLDAKVNVQELRKTLLDKHNILYHPHHFAVNETYLYRSNKKLVNSFKAAIKEASKS